MVLDEATLVAVTSATPARPRLLPAKPLWPTWGGQERQPAVMRTVIAALRLGGEDPQAAAVARSRPSSPAPSRQAISSGWWKDSG